MASQQPIFRTITVAHGQSVTLGEPIPADVLPLTEADGPNRRKMIKGDFGGADSIVMQLTAAQNVQNIAFTYAAGTDYADMVENFVNELGQPRSQTGNSATWQDSQTSFELSNNGSVSSLLADLAGQSAA